MQFASSTPWIILSPILATVFSQLDASVKEAFDVAYDNIYAFHLAQKSAETSVENMKVSKYYWLLAVFPLCTNFSVLQICQGVRCKRVARSIGSVGLYVPGGTAVLPSTALMLSVVS